MEWKLNFLLECISFYRFLALPKVFAQASRKLKRELALHPELTLVPESLRHTLGNTSQCRLPRVLQCCKTGKGSTTAALHSDFLQHGLLRVAWSCLNVLNGFLSRKLHSYAVFGTDFIIYIQRDILCLVILIETGDDSVKGSYIGMCSISVQLRAESGL